MLPAPSTFHLIVTTCPTSTHTHSMVITQYLSPISRTIKYIYVKIKQVIQNVNFHTVQIFKTNSSVVQVITKSRCLRVSFSSSNGIISLLDICHACPMENISNKHTRCPEPAKQRKLGNACVPLRRVSLSLSLSISLWLTLTIHAHGKEHHRVRHGGINAGWVSVVSSCRRLRERKGGGSRPVYATACSSGVESATEPRVRNARWRDKLIARMLACSIWWIARTIWLVATWFVRF